MDKVFGVLGFVFIALLISFMFNATRGDVETLKWNLSAMMIVLTMMIVIALV